MNWGHVVRNTAVAIGITFVTAVEAELAQTQGADRKAKLVPSGSRPPQTMRRLPIGLRMVDIPLSWFNDELLDRSDLSPCVPSGPPRTLASPLLTTALAPVHVDRFGACRQSRAARRAW